MSRIGIFAAAVLLAIATYWIVERPIRFGKQAQGIKAVVLVGLLVGIGGAGGYVFWKEGMPMRESISTKPKTRMVLTKDFVRLFYKNPENHSCEHLSDYQADIKSQTCDYYDVKGKVTVALVGYSHARAAFPDVAAYNASKGVNTLVIWNPGGTNPVDIIGTHPFNYVDRNIIRLSEWVFSTLEQDPKIHKVFLFAEFENMQQAIYRLHVAGKQVYAVEPHPKLPFDIESILPGQPFRPKKEVHILRSREEKRYASVRQQAQQLKNVKIIFTRDAFCQIEECLVFDTTGRPLYFDSGHLTPGVGGKILLEKALKPYLDE
jgi:hypothetical protein